jgi:DinB superfamily
MTVFNKQNLLSELMDRTDLINSNTRVFFRLSNEQLNNRPAPGKWSIAEIFEHLNITHRIYINFILTKITKATDVNASLYKSGWIGDWVYEKIMPKSDGTVFKMKAPKTLRPASDTLDGKEVLNRFLQQQDAIYDIIRHASTKDLQGIKIPFAFTNTVKLRLGDNLRFLIAHNERHLLQAQRIMEAVDEKITLQ